MTELLNRAFEEMAKLPQDLQDKVAQRLLEEFLPLAQRRASGAGQRVAEAAVPHAGLRALVGLLPGPFDVDSYLAEARGPAWRRSDGPGTNRAS